MLLLVRLRIPGDGSLFQEQAQVVFIVTSQGLQCHPKEIILKEQTTSVSPQSWNKAPSAASHHDPNIPWVCFVLSSASGRFVRISGASQWCSKGQRVQWWPAAPPRTGDWARSGAEAVLSITHSPGNPQPGDSCRAKPGSPGWRRQETRRRCSCSATAAWNQLQHFYWFHSFHHLPFLLRTAFSIFPAIPWPCLHVLGCRGQWNLKDHSSNQKDLQELFKDLWWIHHII